MNYDTVTFRVNANYLNIPVFARGYFDALAELNSEELELSGENIFPENIQELLPDVLEFWEYFKSELLDTEGDEYQAGMMFAISRHGYGDGLKDKTLDNIATSDGWAVFTSASPGVLDNGEYWLFVE